MATSTGVKEIIANVEDPIIFVQKLIMKRSELNLKQQYFKARFKFINLYSK